MSASTGNFLVNQVSVLTSVVEFDALTLSVIIPSGARTIDILNTSSTAIDISITGNQTQEGLTLGSVVVAQNVTFSFVDLGKPYPAITIEGHIGATANIVACY